MNNLLVVLLAVVAFSSFSGAAEAQVQALQIRGGEAFVWHFDQSRRSVVRIEMLGEFNQSVIGANLKPSQLVFSSEAVALARKLQSLVERCREQGAPEVCSNISYTAGKLSLVVQDAAVRDVQELGLGRLIIMFELRPAPPEMRGGDGGADGSGDGGGRPSGGDGGAS